MANGRVNLGNLAAALEGQYVLLGTAQTASAESLLLGRGQGGGTGLWQPITLGSGLALTGTVLSATAVGTGDVVGPAASVDGEIALYDLTTGKLIKRATGTGIARVTAGVYGTPGNVVESEITLADNTTNDVSTTQHGFAPKLPNDSTKFLNGVGGYSVPAGSGGGSGAIDAFLLMGG